MACSDVPRLGSPLGNVHGRVALRPPDTPLAVNAAGARGVLARWGARARALHPTLPHADLSLNDSTCPPSHLQPRFRTTLSSSTSTAPSPSSPSQCSPMTRSRRPRRASGACARVCALVQLGRHAVVARPQRPGCGPVMNSYAAFLSRSLLRRRRSLPWAHKHANICRAQQRTGPTTHAHNSPSTPHAPRALVSCDDEPDTDTSDGTAADAVIESSPPFGLPAASAPRPALVDMGMVDLRQEEMRAALQIANRVVRARRAARGWMGPRGCCAERDAAAPGAPPRTTASGEPSPHRPPLRQPPPTPCNDPKPDANPTPTTYPARTPSCATRASSVRSRRRRCPTPRSCRCWARSQTWTSTC